MKVTQPGDIYGRLTVEAVWRERRASGKGWRYISTCRCDCGEIRSVETGNLRSKNGPKACHACSPSGRRREMHGHSYGSASRTPSEDKCYCTWTAMLTRCQNPKSTTYHRYGGKGIGVCERWSGSYLAFLEDMGLPPSLEHQIDRTDNDVGYSPENCRWVTRQENARNKGSNRLIRAFGKILTIAEWSDETGFKRETIARRLERGMIPEKALAAPLVEKGNTRRVSCPKGTFSTITECAESVGMSVSGVFGRINSERSPEWLYLDD